MQVRALRNACAEFMTNHQAKIGVFQQFAWFYRNYLVVLRTGSYRIYLFYLENAIQPFGYGALQLSDNALYITECVHPDYRGRGYGKEILRSLMAIADKERRILVAEIWASNQASVMLHTKAGFHLVETRIHKSAQLEIYHWSPENL